MYDLENPSIQKKMVFDFLLRAYPDQKIPDRDMTPLFNSLYMALFLVSKENINEVMNDFRKV